MTSLEFPMFTVVCVYLSSVLSRFLLAETRLFFFSHESWIETEKRKPTLAVVVVVDLICYFFPPFFVVANGHHWTL